MKKEYKDNVLSPKEYKAMKNLKREKTKRRKNEK